MRRQPQTRRSQEPQAQGLEVDGERLLRGDAVASLATTLQVTVQALGEEPVDSAERLSGVAIPEIARPRPQPAGDASDQLREGHKASLRARQVPQLVPCPAERLLRGEHVEIPLVAAVKVAVVDGDEVLALLRLDPKFLRLNDAVNGMHELANTSGNVVRLWTNLGNNVGEKKVSTVASGKTLEEEQLAAARGPLRIAAARCHRPAAVRRVGGAEKLAPGSRRSQVTRCTPADTGPVRTRTGVPSASAMVKRIASAYEAASRRRVPPPAFGPLPAKASTR